MAEKKFLYKEAVVHGWAMTKKYWKPVFLAGFIYLLFSGMGSVLSFFAGDNVIQKSAVVAFYQDEVQGEGFYSYLQLSGYIDQAGIVQKKLQDAAAPADLVLTPDLEARRTDIYNFLNVYRYRLPFPRPVFFLFTVLLWIMSVLLSIGLTKVFLKAARDEDPDIAEMFTGWGLLVPVILGGLCYALTVLGGLILLIVPGLIFLIMFQMYYYLIIDKGLGPVAALKRSRVITKGERGRLAVFMLLLLLLNIGGLLCLVVGVLVTGMISYIAMAHVYDRLENAPDVTAQVTA